MEKLSENIDNNDNRVSKTDEYGDFAMDEKLNTNLHEENVKKTPLDAKIIGGFLSLSGLLGILLGVVLVTGIGHFTSESETAILFGLFTVSSELGHGIYNIIGSIYILIGSYGLIRRRKYGWWVMISFCAYFFLEGMLSGTKAHIWAFFMYGGVTLWLLCRSKTYGVRIFRKAH
jgi:hypothetical protein